jgi:hypothetical protein
MSGQNPHIMPIQGVGGTGPPPDNPTTTSMPTPTTFGAPTGHPTQVTPPQQYTYGYPVQMPMMPVHQANQPPTTNYFPAYPVTQMPPRMQTDAFSNENESQRSPTLGLGAGSKRSRQDDTPGGHQRFRTVQHHQPTLRSFENDVFNTQNPETTQTWINSALDHLENLVNNATIENINQSTKDRIQALANRLNGNDIGKTLGKITEVLEKLTTQGNTPNETTPHEQKTANEHPQKRTFAKVAASKKVTTRTPKAEEPPSLRHHPRRVIVITQEKPPVHARTPAIKFVSMINAKLQELNATFKVQSASWTDAGNLVFIVPTPDNATTMVTEFEKWTMCLPTKASHAQLDTKTHQIVIQRAYLRNPQDQPMTPTEIERELCNSNSFEENALALRPRILVARNALENTNYGPIMIAFRNEIDAEHYKTFGIFFKGEHCYTRDYIETKRINRCLNCHELTHPTRSCNRRPRCVHCTSTDHTSADHPKHDCKECRNDAKCPHNNLKCANCNGNHASNDPGCPVWLKRRGLLKDAGPTQRGPPPRERERNRHAANLADLVKPARGSQRQRRARATTQNDQVESCESEEEMDHDA